MPIALDHLIIPSRDRVAAARVLAELLDVRWSAQARTGPFSAVYISDGLTLDFDQWEAEPPVNHYAFRVDDPVFDRVLARLQAAGVAYRSLPHGPDDRRINTADGGRRLYWRVPDAHVWELLTVSDAR